MVSELVSEFFPKVNLRLIVFNDCTINSFFPYKDVIPAAVKSNITYKYECRIYYSIYYGESHRHFRIRVAELREISSLTGNPLISTNKMVITLKLIMKFCLTTFKLFSPQTRVTWKLMRASPFIDSSHRWMGWSYLFLLI